MGLGVLRFKTLTAVEAPDSLRVGADEIES